MGHFLLGAITFIYENDLFTVTSNQSICCSKSFRF